VRYYWLLRTIEANEVDMHLIPRLVKEGDTVIDIGANSADWTWRLSKQVGARGRVFAFEADPYYAEVTRKVIKLLGLRNVTFFAYGLSDRQGTAALQIRTPDNQRVVGTGHIVGDSHTNDHEQRATVQIELMALDQVPEIQSCLGSIRLIKCDVEGHELNVFKGALAVISLSRPFVITEVGHMEYQADNKQPLLAFFEALNYDCYVVASDGRSLVPSQPDDEYIEDTRPNRVMVPKEKGIIAGAAMTAKPSVLD